MEAVESDDKTDARFKKSVEAVQKCFEIELVGKAAPHPKGGIQLIGWVEEDFEFENGVSGLEKLGYLCVI